MERLHIATSKDSLGRSWLAASALIIIATMVALASTPPVELDAAVCHQQPVEACIDDHTGSHLDEPPLTSGSFLVHTRGYEATTGR